MTLNELKQDIETRSREEIDQIREKSEQTATAILTEAREKADAIRITHLERKKAAITEEKVKKIYEAVSAMRMRLNEEKENTYNLVFETALQKLSDVRQTEQYPHMFSALLEESIRNLGGGAIVVHVDAQDAELCKRVLAEKNIECTVVSDIRCCGGLNVSRADGSTTVYNTLESRMERAQEVYKRELYRTLYGD